MNVREIAGITIGLTGNGKTFDEVSEHLDFIPTTTASQVDIMLEISSNDIFHEYLPEVNSAKGLMSFNKDEYFVGYLPSIDYLVSDIFNTKGAVPVVKVKVTEDKLLKKIIKYLLLRRKAYKSNLIMSYSLFWYIFQIVLMTKSKSFIHAATLYDNKRNRAILLGGTGGCGKTSTALEMLDDSRYSYLSEDFSIINLEGQTFFNPKPVSVYCSDIEHGSKILNDFKCSFNFTKKLEIFLKRSIFRKNPIFKVSPQNLFGERLSISGQCSYAFYVIRSNVKSPKLKDCTLDEIVDRFVESSIRELKTYTELSNLILANDLLNTGVISYSVLKENMEEIYRQFLKKTEYKILLLPHKVSPKETINFLEKEKFL
ncbi:hypothetical protein GCM10007891_01320 [Methylophaga thalassica]|uniref:HprK-related kinase B n=1 Tax=Methylophaga thalassica TaxID=40223 RepID=A0ABQ5TQ64_9GAMM|nr:hypothetical protein [Methylophaga thalassica]GLP98278.1 hypothetical protein GCM10007891_01320 [Methylophaga thalassica]